MNDRTNADPAATHMPPLVAAMGLGSASGSSRLEVRCPNCHAPTEVAVDTSLTDLTCSGCGSHFSLVDQSKATRMAPSLMKMGRFELIERLGVGGFGSVWKARDKELDRTVAVKIPRQGGMTTEEQEKFFREARAAAQLKHPNIVSVHEVGRDGDSVYIVSDFVRGVTLGDWLTGQQLTSREAAELCAKLADALHHAHEQGVVHRDLKPANIMIDGDGQPHLMDFGLARREVGEVTVTVDGQILGTPAYMSPEQAQGESHTADCRSDVYSLGVILFQLLTGELPFRGNARMIMHQVIHDEPPSPRKLNANIKRDLETITLKCLEKSPDRRYRSALELAEELRRFLSGEPIQARPIGRIERGCRWTKRNPRIATLTASVAILLITVAALSTVGLAIAKKQQMAAEQAAVREANLRELAEENLKLAEQAVEGYLTRVAEDDRLKQDDFHKLRTELLETAAPFYERFAEQKPGDAHSEANRASAYARLASIHGKTGQHDRSVAEYEQAIALQSQLATRHSDVAEHRRNLANYHAELGWNFHVVGKYDKARLHYQDALNMLRETLPDSQEPGVRKVLAITHERLGLLLSRSGNTAAAREQYEQAIAIASVLVDDFPDAVDCQSVLANSLFRLGFLLRPKPEEARDYLRQAADIQRKLAASHPRNSEYRAALAESVAYLGDALHAAGDAAGARRQYEEGIEIQQLVVAEFPSVVKYHVILQGILSNYVNLLHKLGDQASARTNYEQYITLLEKQVADLPDTPMFPNALAGMLITSPVTELRDGKRAVELATRACELTEYNNPVYLDTLASACAEMGDFEAAIQWTEKAIAALDGSEEGWVRQAMSRSLLKLQAKRLLRAMLTRASE